MQANPNYHSPSTPLRYVMLRDAADNLDAARNWYAAATAEIRTICDVEQWQQSHFTGILAVTSPRCAVRRNVRITLHYLGTGQLLDNVMRSIRSSVAHWEAATEIRGPKTSAFYAALMGDVNAVVLDTHMAGYLQVDQKTAFTRKPEIAYWTAYIRDIARELGESPVDVQAALWYARKLSIGEYPEGFPILAEYRNWLAHNRQFPTSGVIAGDDDDTSFDVASFEF